MFVSPVRHSRMVLSRRGHVGILLNSRLKTVYPPGGRLPPLALSAAANSFDGFIPIRALTSSSVRYGPADQKRSKVEETLQMLKEDLQRQVEEARIDREKEVKLVPAKLPDGSDRPSLTVAERTQKIWQKVKHELAHYYHGFRLLALEIRLSAKYLWRVLRGTSLNRLERRQLVRTVSDLFRLVPFSFFIIVPFMELLLPFFIKFFPGMLPSTFQEASKEEEKLKRSVKVRLEMAKFLQDTIEEIALEKKGAKAATETESKATAFSQFMQKMRTEGGYVSNAELFKFSKLFEDELTLDNLSMAQLRALCRLLLIQPLGTPNVLRFQLNMKLRELKADDRQIMTEGGVDALSVAELQHACRARGMRSLGLSEDRLRAQLKQWLELSQSDKVPPSLLLLSRALYLPENLTFADRLKSLVSQLPENISEQTRQRLTELEGGKVDHKARLDLIRNIEDAIKNEREEQKKAAELEQAKAKSKSEKAMEEAAKEAAKEEQKVEPMVQPPQPIIVDFDLKDYIAQVSQPVAVDGTVHVEDTKEQKKEQEDKITHKDLAEIEGILHKAGGELHEAKQDIAELKEQIMEHTEDLAQVKGLVGDLKESKVAKRLRSRVNSMISNVDSLIDQLQKEKQTLGEELEDVDQRKEKVVRINDLVESLTQLQQIGDEKKKQRIQEVLTALDDDTDGVIDVNLALEVIELLGKDNDVKISASQMSNIIGMLRKEDAVEALDKIKVEVDAAVNPPSSSSPPPPPPPIPAAGSEPNRPTEQRKQL
uniref:Mitochondrial proton/calcium exchanger protein n=1 Tax=Plectus sambesii TaxID=2011161 RepID=A0A914WSC7_9BILA